MRLKNKNILYLSHTDIRYDSRILKYIKKSSDESAAILALGIEDKGDSISKKSSFQKNIFNRKLKSRKLNYLPRFLRHFFSFFEFFVFILQKCKNKKIDIIHCNDVVVLAMSCVIRFIYKSKLIYDAHELSSDQGASKIFQLFALICEILCRSQVDLLLVVSPSIKKWYIKKLKYKKVSVIYNSPQINGNLNLNNNNYLRKKFSININVPILIYVGGYFHGRNLEVLINIISKYKKQISLVLIGFGHLEKKLKKMSINSKNIFFHKPVAHDNILDVIGSADFGISLIENVSLSDYLSLPNKVFEYAFSGLTIISSNFPDMKNFVRQNKLGYVIKTDINSIENFVKKIIARKIKKIQPNKNLYKYSWDFQSEKLINSYISLLII